MDRNEIRRAILELVRDPAYRPLKPKGIARRLRLAQDQSKDVRKVVKQMVARGELLYAANHFVQAAEGTKTRSDSARQLQEPSQGPTGGIPDHWIVGVFRRNEKGFGFVRPRTPTGVPSGEADIYIPAQKTRDAATGDLVAVQPLRRARGGLPGLRGEIVRVLERDRHQFVGTYLERATWGVVEVDGGVFAQPIVVGDPSATAARPGDKVVIEIVRFPTHQHDGEGVITEILGERGTPGLDTLLILREFGLPDRFDESIRHAARDLVEGFDADGVLKERHDATDETTVTIDPPDARDFDDAISLEHFENGHYRLGVHIADVSHFVRPGSPLDREAKNRATSVYLPDRVVPMLPEVLSNGLASLQPGKPRLTKSVYIEFDAKGIRVATDARNAVIRSNKRLNYDEVDQFLDDPEPFRQRWDNEVHSLVGRMHQLAMILRRRRLERGALELALPEVRIELDDRGHVSGAKVRQHTEAHQIIEEFMLAANEAVAELLADEGTPFLRRIHKPPSLRKMRIFGQFVEEVFRERKHAAADGSAEPGFYESPEAQQRQDNAPLDADDQIDPYGAVDEPEFPEEEAFCEEEDETIEYRELDWEPEEEEGRFAGGRRGEAIRPEHSAPSRSRAASRQPPRVEEPGTQATEAFDPDFDFTVDPTSLASRFAIQRLLQAVQGCPEEKAVNYFLLRSLQKAEYAPREEGHYALASPSYCHFTSPIRRYPDVTVHRLLDQWIAGKRPRADFDELTLLGAHCSEREQRAEQAERELTKLKLLDYMSRRIGHRMTGVITGIESFGLFIQGTEIPAEGLAHIDSLSDDYYRFDRATYTLSGYRTGNTYRLGDMVRVVVVRVDLDRRELDLRVVGRVHGDGEDTDSGWESLPPVPLDERTELMRRDGRPPRDDGRRKRRGRRKRGVFIPDGPDVRKPGGGRGNSRLDGKTKKSKNSKKTKKDKKKRGKRN